MSEYPVVPNPAASATPVGSIEPERPSAKDKAAQSAQAGTQAAGDIAQTAVNTAHDVVGEGKAQARNLVGEARDQLRGQAADQHHRAVTSLRSLADQLHSMAESGQRGETATELVGQAADRAHDAASWLDRREPGDLIEELRRFARRRPAAFLAGALVAGVVAGRLTRGVVAAHSDDDGERAQSPQSGPETHVEYAGDQALAYRGEPGGYLSGRTSAEPHLDPTSSAPRAGWGVTP
jgi:hypothetical protein